ncbi:MAG: aromatic amino acid transport family protein [Patescibacteria group bacterium]
MFRTLKAVGLLAGMIIGAGMFALPYTIVKAGIGWSLFHTVIVLILVTLTHALYAGVILKDKRHARLPGYARQYLGEGGFWITLISRLLAYWGFLLAYGIIIGDFLAHILPFSEMALAISFFVIISPLILFRLSRIGSINFILTLPEVFLPIIFFFIWWPQFDFSAVPFGGNGDWFLPYGIFLFALSGASVIPEVIDTLGASAHKKIFPVIVVSGVIAILIYAAFSITIIGLANGLPPHDSLSVLASSIGERAFIIGTLLGLLAVITSYIALGLELRYTFEYDLGRSSRIAWMLTAFVPLVIYLAGVRSFILLIDIIGAVGVGIEGTIIALLARRVLGTQILVAGGIAAALIVGAAFELIRVSGFL